MIDKETQFQKHIRIFMEGNNLEDGDYFTIMYVLDFMRYKMKISKEKGIISTLSGGDASLLFIDALRYGVEKEISDKDHIKEKAIETVKKRIDETKKKLKEAQEELEEIQKM